MSNSIVSNKGLSSAKEALLKKLSARNNNVSNDIQPQNLSEGILSSTQQRLYYMQKLNPNSGFYNVPTAIEINAKIDPQRFEACLHLLINKHKILRTSYHETQDSKLIQRINKSTEIDYKYVDFNKDTNMHDVDNRIINFILEETHKPLELEKPPVRFFLLKSGEDKHVFLFISHHIMIDGRTTEILINDLKNLYEMKSNEYTLETADEYNYIDFAIWETDYFASEEYKNSLNYWRQQLEGEIDPIDLPKDYARKNESNRIGDRVLKTIPSESLKGINNIARDFKTTKFAVLYTCLNLLLHKLTGNSEIIIGTQVGNRKLSVFDEIAGYFANTVVLKTPIKENDSFSELVQRSSETVLDAFTHQNVPFEKIVEMKGLKRNLSLNPLFQVMLVYQVSNFEALQFGDGEITPLEFHNGTSKFDLDISIVESQDELIISFEYDTELFKKETIKNFLNCYLNVITEENLLNKKVSNIDILEQEERTKITTLWNTTEVDFSKSEWPIHKFIEKWVKKDPNADAILLSNGKVSRAELLKKANQIAWWLIDMHLSRKPIGVCLNRSVNLVSSLLGIVKSGSAYLPIDPILPDDRIDYMINDSQVPVVITSTEYLEKFKNTNAQILNIDEFAWELSTENPVIDVSPDDLFYVIYTSGTSGKPKGVILNHRGRINNFFDFINQFNIGENDKLLSISALSFDMTAFDIFGVLAAGSAIVLPSKSEERNPEIWLDLIEKYNISIWHSAPALLKLLIEKLESSGDNIHLNMRLILLGGDWIPLDLQERLSKFNKEMQYISLGGATEVSMDSTIYEVEKTESHWNSIPYGKPMANQRAYIIDDYGFPVPVGVSGELCLGGIGVGYGYLNQPALTADKFIPDPYWIPGARMYRTGDLARFNSDGTLELLGRMDFQIKIDGYRIESGEIESLIKQFSGIDAAVVSVYKEPNGKQKLVAYYTKSSESDINNNELRRYLADKLPYYMVPMYFVELEQMPLSPNGKVNRKGLPTLVVNKEENKELSIPPKTKNEFLLCDVWSEVLDCNVAEVNKSFFELGGDSIKAIQVVNELRRSRFVIELKDIIKYPTINELAKVIVDNSNVNSVSFTGEQLYLLATNQWNSTNTIEVPLASSMSQDKMKKILNEIISKVDVFKLFIIRKDNFFAQYYHETSAELVFSEQASLPEKEQFQHIKDLMNLNKPFPVHALYVGSKNNNEESKLYITISQMVADRTSMFTMKKLIEGYISNTLVLENSERVFANWASYIKSPDEKETFSYFKRGIKFEQETKLPVNKISKFFNDTNLPWNISFLDRTSNKNDKTLKIGCRGQFEQLNKEEKPELFVILNADDLSSTLSFYVLDEDKNEKLVADILNSLATFNEPLTDIEYPVLPMQNHIIKQLEEQPLNGLYNIQSGFFIPGYFNKEAFIKSYAYLIDKYEILRAYFNTKNKNNIKISFRSEIELPLSELDWSNYSEHRIRLEINKLSQEIRHSKMDLSKAPIWRIFLIEISEELTLFLHFNCYALLDGWSMNIIRRELFRAYQSFSEGSPLSVKCQDLSFSDCCQIINDLDKDKKINYWEEKIKTTVGKNTFNEEKSLKVSSKVSFKQESFQLDKSINEKLTELSRKEGITKTELISFAWGKTMQDIYKEDKVMFGVTMSGRSLGLADLENVPGQFINTLPIYMDLSLERTTEEIFYSLRNDLTESDGREQVGLDQIKRMIGRENKEDLYDTILVFDNYPVGVNLMNDNNFISSNPFADMNLSIAQTEFPLRVDIWLDGNTQIIMSWYENKLSENTIRQVFEQFSQSLNKCLTTLTN
ncbi:amino acid adenylation domain-containing protein [Gracilibacillus orientalis]|uniref:Amino acid adenylation domain-containing protein n=1 Tax=Gracilibacillus orientalis TaxID=334253 RepID=A0A1I4H776_9BACI|nr:non-ribosomal peptide synthetase [Gracilibacillus orientalis]SFL37620.1 amino acid adenylation domain-containing protein [Gracilibacillus orientalis]